MQHSAVARLAADRAFAGLAGQCGRRRAQIRQRREIDAGLAFGFGIFRVIFDAAANDSLSLQVHPIGECEIAIDDSTL